MSSFEFRNKLTVNIEGKNYTIDTSMIDVSKAIGDLISSCAKVQQLDVPDQSEALTKACLGFCTTILGDDAVKQISGNRVLDRIDWIDLCNYLNQQIISFKRGKLETFMMDHVQSDSRLVS